ncbi:MAG: alpha-mannosidase, partial [Fermentimonas sp.]|nr:alpha-mannosidase [Fermentimonas sp.]
MLSFLISASLPGFAQKQSVVIQPVSPIEYKSEKGTLKVLNYVKLPEKVNARLSATLDGVSIEVMPTNKGDSLLVWLPMIGESNHLQIHAGKIQWVDQSVYPMIPKDWGYFQ